MGMTGSPKQTAWAEQIRSRILDQMEWARTDIALPAGWWDGALTWLREQSQARWWIDHREPRYIGDSHLDWAASDMVSHLCERDDGGKKWSALVYVALWLREQQPEVWQQIEGNIIARSETADRAIAAAKSARDAQIEREGREAQEAIRRLREACQ